MGVRCYAAEMPTDGDTADFFSSFYRASCRNSGIARSKPRMKRSTTSSISLRVMQSGGENEVISP
jgi:hypothetical protein